MLLAFWLAGHWYAERHRDALGRAAIQIKGI